MWTLHIFNLRFQDSPPNHMHVLFKNVLHPIQNLHLMPLLFYHYIYVKPDPGLLSHNHNSCSVTWSHQPHLSMSSLPLLLLLVLCVSLHACTARPLRITKKDTAAKYHFDKEIGKVKLLNICESCSSTSTLKEMIVGGTPGTELSTSSQTDSPSFLATKEQRRHARSMLGPDRHHAEETTITNPSDTAEDIVEMDYAQPHRKPPIHNDKP